ncbi:methyltransferase domain-containing protein [Kangiella sediminilitoris]|uniref:tRNA (guanine(46)-N(7))-methyltransferase n=1 Tax=Kangiella sediminilitoris TaxID=1144748 RepID=A0A1B3B8T8_9GAMM|nr:DUF938 domain-containing protein [Kangiella sediminilitoris]AOE49195.1 Putative methyltransferase [Kangiella sediminilitoris]
MNKTPDIRAFRPEKLFKPRNFIKPALSQKQYLEIGAGKGMHAMQFAEANPDKELIAVERTKNKFDVFAQRAKELKLDNLTPVHADALPYVVHAFPAKSLDGVFLLYPNPEPKSAAQRWLNMPFFEFLLSRMKDGASVVLASNIESYIDEAEQQARELWQLPVERKVIPKTSSRTHFEVKYLQRGELCQELVITKPEGYQTRFDY